MASRFAAKIHFTVPQTKKEFHGIDHTYYLPEVIGVPLPEGNYTKRIRKLQKHAQYIAEFV